MGAIIQPRISSKTLTSRKGWNAFLSADCLVWCLVSHLCSLCSNTSSDISQDKCWPVFDRDRMHSRAGCLWCSLFLSFPRSTGTEKEELIPSFGTSFMQTLWSYICFAYLPLSILFMAVSSCFWECNGSGFAALFVSEAHGSLRCLSRLWW